jgi:hypothetical protein
MSDIDPFGEDADEKTYAQGRLASRTYASRSFSLERTNSADDGSPARFICKVFDPESESTVEREGTEWTIRSTPAGRYQFKLLVAREAGNVKDLWIQRVPAPGQAGQVKNLLHLPQAEAATLIEFLRALDAIPVEGDATVRVDDSLIQDLFANHDALTTLYQRDPSHFRRLISDDASARDVVATAARRSAVEEFRQLLYDDEHFDARQTANSGNGAESVWQDFFEANPWIFGVSLAGQLLTSWSEERLEQVVAGSSISDSGKRADALMRTAGVVRSMVFAEIKTHRTDLLGPEYRPGCWRASIDLTGGVAQVQGTVHRATLEVGERIADRAGDGSEIPGEFTYLLRPRSFLVIGRLDELVGEAGGVHNDRVRSFELFRRHLQEPEVVTFDELLARAEWVVETSEE